METPESLTLLHRLVLHLPVVTTVCAAFFCYTLFSRYRKKGGGLHLLWWGIGMATYGVGTLTEATTTIAGWDPTVFRLWYISGAFLGGYPLAQGSIYLLMKRRFAHASAIVVSSVIAVASVLVWLAPLDPSLAEAHRLSGEVIGWQWVRLISPFINVYSLIFLVGGAVVSAMRFRKAPALRHRYLGNIWIAVGALLPGIGGSLTRAGFVEALYVTELAGLLMIYAGYRLNVRDKKAALRVVGPSAEKMAAALAVGLLLAAPGALPAQDEPSEPPAAEDAAEAPAGDTEETADEEEKPSFYATTTVTARGRETAVLETATPVTVIEEREIERRMPQNAADLLRDEPGVDVDGVGLNQARPIIRGQRGLRVLFLADGLRMNNPRRQTDFGEIPGLIDIDTVERVEVVRGPASVLYGSDAIGGVLNLVTRRPGAVGSELGVELTYGSAGDVASGHVGWQQRNDRWSLSLDGSIRDSEDYEAPSGTFGEITLDESTPVTDTGLADDSLAGVFRYGVTETQELTLRAQRYRADETGFGFVDPAALGDSEDFRIRILYPFQDFDRYTAGYSATALDLPFADTVDARLYHQNNERQLANDIDITVPAPPVPGAPGLLIEADTLNFTDLETTGLRFEGIKGFADRHLVTWGVDAYEDDSFNTDASTTTTSLTFPFPPFVMPIDVSTDTVANAPNAENSSYGVFAQAELVPTDRMTVTVGARYQSVDTSAQPTPQWDISGLDFEDDATVGAVSLIYQATEELRVFGSYGTAFRAPNIIERLFNGPTPEGAGYQILNRDLMSEDSETFDLGVKYQRANALFELTLFRNDIEDGIIQYFLAPDEIAQLPPDVQAEIALLGDDVFVVQQINADRLRYEGVELALGWRSEGGVQVGGNYTYIDGERLDSTNPPTGDTFSDKATAYVRWQPRRRPFWAEYRVRHNGDDKANLDPGEPVPPVGETLPSFTVHTLAGGWTFLERGDQRHELLLRIENLTDELYAEFSNATFFRPQPERSIRLGYRLRL